MSNNKEAYARVKVSGKPEKIIVPVKTESEVVIPEEIRVKWQEILDLVCELVNVPSSLIMQLHTDQIEVFLSGQTNETPYREHDSENLGLGLYCETVVGKREELFVPDALVSEEWKDNPDVKLNMISYLGVPVRWQNGEIFGTFCILDSKEKQYTEEQRKLIYRFRDMIETDLRLIETKEELEARLSANELATRELHHRIKNQFNILLSFIKLKGRMAVSEDNFPQIINDISSKVHAMAFLHEKLYRTVDVTRLSLSEYIRELVKVVLDEVSGTPVNLKIKGDDFTLSSDTIMTLGLIITELVTNSLKHAFKGVVDPAITIEISEINSSLYRLIYEDNGPGIRNPDRPFFSDSLGMSIIKALTEQLSGKITIENAPGARFGFVFKRK